MKLTHEGEPSGVEMIFRKREKEREIKKLKLYVKQLEQFYSNLLKERDLLKKELDSCRDYALTIVEQFVPSKYSTSLSLMNALEIIYNELREALSENVELRNKLKELELLERERTIKTPEGSGEREVRIGLGLESLMKVSKESALRKWERLSTFEKEAFHEIIIGNCTEELLSVEGKGRKASLVKAKSSLIEKGFIRALSISKTSGKFKAFEVYFPSPLGVKVCEIIAFEGRVMPWTLLQYEYALKKQLTLNHDELVKATVNKLRHANYELSLDDYDLLVHGTNHRADIYIVKPEELYIECETLSNSLEDTFRMINAYVKTGKAFSIVVASEQAKYMMLQRLCFYSWEVKRSLSFKLTTIRDIPNMTSYVILR